MGLRWCWRFAVVAICCWPVAYGQQVPASAAAVREGASLFRGNCSPCHGLDGAGGGRGPDLTLGRWIHGGADADIFRTITQGVAGTEMPANSFEDSEVWSLVAYLRSISGVSKPRIGGSIKAGQQLFFGKEKCIACHMVGGQGGHLGPDLSRVGAARSAAYLAESVREPSKELSLGYVDPNNHYGIPLEYDTVLITTRDGRKLKGVAKNEDAFSVQLLDENDQMHLLLKKDLAEVRHEERSLMPAYTLDMLSDSEWRDLLAYLSSLRGESF